MHCLAATAGQQGTRRSLSIKRARRTVWQLLRGCKARVGQYLLRETHCLAATEGLQGTRRSVSIKRDALSGSY